MKNPIEKEQKECGGNDGARTGKQFSLSLPLSGEYLTTVRLATGGLCALTGFDLDSAEDFKVCVTESLLILKRNGFRRAEVIFGVKEKSGAEEGGLSCTVNGFDGADAEEKDAGDEISYALLDALIGNTRFVRDERGAVRSIAFEA